MESDNDGYTAKLQGVIAVGDVDLLVSEFSPIASLARLAGNLTLSLDSGEGGDFDEGLRIAEFAREYGVSTRVDNDAQCISACAFAFLGGTRELGGERPRPSRYLVPGANLCFHAPTLSHSKGIFDDGVAAVARLFDKLGPMVPQDFLVEVLSYDRDHCRPIETIADIIRIGIDLDQYALPAKNVPELFVFAVLNTFGRNKNIQIEGLPFVCSGEDCNPEEGLFVSEPIMIGGEHQSAEKLPFIYKLSDSFKEDLRLETGDPELFIIRTMASGIESMKVAVAYTAGDTPGHLLATVFFDEANERVYVVEDLVDEFREEFGVPVFSKPHYVVPAWYMYPSETHLKALRLAPALPSFSK
ncbi:hypothetical protein I6F26_00380 [Ensifer sp. IC3342]|nr:hypothetical protein [Ensifer sp. BRP08]MCA1445051.1 hypothetical protein [Ensifer sp. IC3342]